MSSFRLEIVEELKVGGYHLPPNPADPTLYQAWVVRKNTWTSFYYKCHGQITLPSDKLLIRVTLVDEDYCVIPSSLRYFTKGRPLDRLKQRIHYCNMLNCCRFQIIFSPSNYNRLPYHHLRIELFLRTERNGSTKIATHMSRPFVIGGRCRFTRCTSHLPKSQVVLPDCKPICEPCYDAIPLCIPHSLKPNQDATEEKTNEEQDLLLFADTNDGYYTPTYYSHLNFIPLYEQK